MLMTTSECMAKYGSFYQIAQAVRSGELHKIAHGVYSDNKRYRDVELLLKKYPAAVVTMLSAYYYYGLTDNVPDKIHVAVERAGHLLHRPDLHPLPGLHPHPRHEPPVE